MPDVVVHISIAERAAEGLAPEIRRLIRPEVFRFAAMAPDLFFAFRFFAPHFRRGVHKRSKAIHDSSPGALVTALAANCESPEAFSFLCGWLCHYAADSTLHPLVNALRGDRGYMHMAIEHKLEAVELKRQGKSLKDVMALLPPFPQVPEARAAMRRVCGWDDGYDRVSYRHTKLLYSLFTDRLGLLNLLLGWTQGAPAALSYRTRLADKLDLSPFDALETEAADLAARLMTAAYRCRAGVIDAEELRAIIGSRNFAGIAVE